VTCVNCALEKLLLTYLLTYLLIVLQIIPFHCVIGYIIEAPFKLCAPAIVGAMVREALSTASESLIDCTGAGNSHRRSYIAFGN